jgi:hypothetical protein
MFRAVQKDAQVLDLTCKLANLNVYFSWRNQKMNMFGHDYPSPQVDWPFLTSGLQSIDKPQTRPVFSKKRIKR